MIRKGSLSRRLRIATLIVPAFASWSIAFDAAQSGALVKAASQALIPLWVVMAGAILVRAIEGGLRHKRIVDQLDVLTTTGQAMVWSAAGAIVASVATGWASLAVVGLLGFAVVAVTVTWTALVAGGDEPWRTATVARKIFPEMAVEADPMREEVTVRGVRIPAGFRLFATGNLGRHGAVTRYVVGSEASGAEVKLESDLGLARRGEHQVAPMKLWLQDVLGLCRTPIAERGEASYTVLPRPGSVDGAKNLLGRGGDDNSSIPTQRLPTEGLFRMREYVAGDDTRRIHWVRSLTAGQLVVRLPDEIPPAEPAVRLILDSHLVGTDSLTCRAPAELLDAMVRVWLGVGRSLADSGTRVTLVAAGKKRSDGDEWAAIERPLHSRSSKESLRLGARVAWQPSLPLSALLASTKARQVVVSSRPRPVEGDPNLIWVVVPEVVWTTAEPWPAEPSWFKLPFPAGVADNRLSRRRAEVRRIEGMRRDGAIFNDLLCWTDWKALSGAFLARPSGTRVALEVIP
jgi:uncharacterized protein (DUF58 family)